jgi:ATPase subunit of ABC transporter with duplicated ATPase domains
VINISELEKRYGPQLLFAGVSLQLVQNQRYGLVGSNGSGKSTFLKLLIGDEGSDGGEISFGKKLRLGVLRQDHFQNDGDMKNRLPIVLEMILPQPWQAIAR